LFIFVNFFYLFVPTNNKKTAYSLIELAIVITIMSILMTGAAAIFTNSMKKAKKNETQQKMQEIYNAMGKFLLREKRLPCPARLDLAKNNVDAYKSSTVSDCTFTSIGGVFSANNFVAGAVPSATLGLSSDMAEDEFGNKILYVVSVEAIKATSTCLPQAGNTGCGNVPQDFPTAVGGDGFGSIDGSSLLTIKEYSNRMVSNKAIMVLVSHGLNGFSAYPANSNVKNTVATSDELTNDKSTSSFSTDIIYSSTNQDFDDIILFKTRNQILSDFNAHHLVLCKLAGINGIDNFHYFTNAGTQSISNSSIFYEQKLFHNLNFCQLICGKYGKIIQTCQ
jgi:prepilin-type N-terminal cleavage/methylation domain-containing protein